MTTADSKVPDPHPLEAAVRRTHRSVLALLACCAGVIVLHGFVGDDTPPERSITTLAVGLGLGSILLRRLGGSPGIRPERGFMLLLAALVLAGSLGLLGTWTAYRADAPETGILLTLGGVILAIRPTRPASGTRSGALGC